MELFEDQGPAVGIVSRVQMSHNFSLFKKTCQSSPHLGNDTILQRI